MNTNIPGSIYAVSILLCCMMLIACLGNESSSEIQNISGKILKENVLQANADSGLVMIMDVESGKVIANMAVINQDSSITRVTQKAYTSANERFGGLIQPIALTAALESGNITLTDSIDTGHGLYIYKDQRIYDSNYNYGGFGKLAVSDILAKSSDIGAFLALIKAFDENSSAYFDQLSRLISALPNVSESYQTDSFQTYLPVKDYGLNLNPIQILTFYNAIANDGKMVFEGSTLDPSIVSTTTITDIRLALQKVVSMDGTGKYAVSPWVNIAGKTGVTNEVNLFSGKNIRSVAMCGYFPSENPKFTMLIKFYNPKNAIYYGSAVVSPVFKQIAEGISD